MAVAALGALASPASAHALLESSHPADGATLDRAPASVTVTFTEPPDPELSRIEVVDSSGGTVSSGPATVVPSSPRTMRVPLRPQLPNGTYTIQWRTTSTADGHSTSGFIAFGVGEAPLSAASSAASGGGTAPTPSAVAVVGRWLLYWGLAVLLATMTMAMLVFRTPAPARAVLAAAEASAVVGLAMIALAESSAAGVSIGALLASDTGVGLLRQGAAVGLAGVAVALAVWRPSRWTLGAVGAASAVALLFHALAGHAGAPASWRPLQVLVQWIHLLAVGIWIGGLASLLVDLRTPRDDRDDRIRRFSTVAGVALGAVLVTGTLRTIDLVGGWTHVGRLLGSGWGDALLWKLALFSTLVGLAAWNRFVNVRHLDDPHATSLRRFVAGEALLAAGIFGVTGVLAGLPPPAQLHATPSAPPAVVVSGSDFATTTRARLVATPGQVGSNRFEVTITDYDTGRPVPATRVAIRFSLPSRPDLGASTVELRRSGPGVWAAQSSAASLEGRWNLVVVVQTASGSTEVPLAFPARPEPMAGMSAAPSGQRTSVSRAPGQPDIYTITLSDGSSVQAYLDPARPGKAEVHFTAFDASGAELPVASASARAVSPAGPRTLALRRLTPGHFVGDVKLAAGAWMFTFDATAESGAHLSVSFSQDVA